MVAMSKVVFGECCCVFAIVSCANPPLILVGNVPYHMAEVSIPYCTLVLQCLRNLGQEQLIDVFKSVGQVVGLRYV